MANTIKTLSDGDITRKALAILHNKLIFCKSINKQYDDRFARSGAKNGGSLLIREPNQFTVRTGAVMDVQDVTESTQTLTVATQKGVDINFSSIELTLSMDDFSERILEPAMTRLAAEVDKDVITGCYRDVYNHVNTTFGTAPVLLDVQSARAKLSKGLAPAGNRFMLMESLGMNSVVNAGTALFNPSSEISRQYNTGLVGHAHGFEFYETEMIPTHTQGTYADTDAGIVNTSTGITSGTATIAITSMTSAATLTNGQVFTVADVYAVNPETKARYKHLQQFVVTADITATTTNVTPAVSPTPITSGAKQNVE
ncbi:MAG: P22 phage major capsid protein family protein, partial [Sedimentisphaerales bacterium]